MSHVTCHILRYELFTVFQSDDSIDVFVANEVVGVSRDGGENDKNWGQSLLVSDSPSFSIPNCDI